MSEFTYHTQRFEGNMNEKMLQVLSNPSTRGVLLFFIYGKRDQQAPGFILPDGFAKNDPVLLDQFRDEFYNLLLKYQP